MRILVVEDESNIQKLLTLILEQERWQVACVSAAEEAKAKLEAGAYEIVLLDWMLEGPMSGVELCRWIGGRWPVVMLTARSNPADIVLGLESGADDYLTKPFEAPVLVARLRAVARRAQARSQEGNTSSTLLTMGTLEVHPESFVVRYEEKTMTVTTQEFKLLVAILKGKGRVLSRKYLLGQIQEKGVVVVERLVDTLVYNLRKKLGAGADFIESVRGVGYRIKP